MKHKKNKNLSYGLTVVELLVAAGIFSIVIAVLTSAFVSTFRGQRNMFSFLQLQNNIRFALETMGREIRTGTQFSVPSPGRLRFVNDAGETVKYCFVGGSIRRQTGSASCSISSPSITSPGVNIERLEFILTGANIRDGIQPRITILIRASSGVFSTNLQLTVTQRELDS
jgi:type II secretory pathway pseudopilin PulG